MEVKPGYKRTEVGVIPEEWEVKPLWSVMRKGRLGGNYPSQVGQTGFPLMKMGNIARGRFDLSKVEHMPPKVTVEAEHRLIAGDVLFNTRNTLDLVGKVAIWRDDLPVAYYNSNLMRLEFEPKEICAAEYANAFLNTDGCVNRLRGLATGTTSVAAIYTRDLLELPFLVPPPDEQRAIATALSDVDALLTQLDRFIAKKRDVKQATMQQLLTGKTRLPGFSGAWLSVKAGEIGRFRGGSGFPTKFQGNGTGTLPFYKVSDMNTPGNEVFMSHANNYIGSEIRAKLRATVFPPMTIVFAKVGAAIFLERKKLLRFASCLDNNMAGYVPEPGITDPRYLHYVFMSTALSDLVSTTALPSLNNRVLASMILRLPPIEEQTAIATLLSELDAELTALEARRDKTRALKQGMMQELLTGRTRLT